MGSARMCVQPSAIAARNGIASNTAASTRRRPRCRIGGPATSGTAALARRHSRRSLGSSKPESSTGSNESRHDATICKKPSRFQDLVQVESSCYGINLSQGCSVFTFSGMGESTTACQSSGLISFMT